jgi:tRNA pseudouridine55 synthase
VLLLDKPEGLSSNHALQRSRRILNARKAGHTGTLDPFATGLMVLCFGEATKFSADMFIADKSYVAELCLGEETDSGDRTGLPVAFEGQDAQLRPDLALLNDVLSRFIGSIEQVPPMYSALKRDGKPLYEYARQGIELEREPRRVTIHAIRLLSFEGDRLSVEVSCSKGTYIRTLAQDIGRVLGCGAHLTALRRNRTAGFDLADAVTLEQLEALSEPAQALMPIEVLLAPLEVMALDADATARFMQGQKIKPQTHGDGADDEDVHQLIDSAAHRVRIHDPDGRFLGTARRDGGWLQPDRLISFKETT